MIKFLTSHGLIRALAIIVLISAAPLAFSSNGVGVNDACATAQTGSCCPYNAMCCVNGVCYFGYDWHSGGGCHPA
jgi:hypothetical protein